MSPTATHQRSWRVRGLLAATGVAAVAATTVAALPAADERDRDHDPLHASQGAPIEFSALEQEFLFTAAAVGEVTLAPDPHATPEPAEPSRTVWDDVADCESGHWTGSGGFVEGSADWASRKHRTFQGGLQFHPTTWRWLRDRDMPVHAADATREQQIEVAERVLARQGWKAWPVCSRKLGLR